MKQLLQKLSVECIVALCVVFFVYASYFFPMYAAGTEVWRGFAFIPVIKPVGNDFRIYYQYAVDLWKLRLVDQTSIYPPFSVWMVSPYIFLSPLNAYRIHGFLIYMVFYLNIVLVWQLFLPELKNQLRNIVVFFLIACMGYPFLFALERGNSDVFACLSCLAFLHFYRKEKYLLAVLCLIPGTQLKIYPLFLSFMLLKHSTRKYFYAFVVLNFLLLFSLGMTGFDTLVSNLIFWNDKPYNWIGNHSAYSFADYFSIWLANNLKIQLAPARLSGLLLLPFLAGWALSLIYFLRNDKNNNTNIFNFFLNSLLFMCVVIAISHDYKLVILYPVIFVLIMKSFTEYMKSKKLVEAFFLIVFISLIYFLNKPYQYIVTDIFANKYPVLILMLIASNLYFILRKRAHE